MLRTGAGLIAILLAAAASAGELYRWVDAEGKVHFGDRPPLEAEAEDIGDDLRPINSADATRPQQFTRSGQQASAQQQYEARQRNQQQQQRRQLERACQRAQRSLRMLQGRVTFVDENGKSVKITERERQQRAARLQREIAQVCS